MNELRKHRRYFKYIHQIIKQEDDYVSILLYFEDFSISLLKEEDRKKNKLQLSSESIVSAKILIVISVYLQ